MRIHQSLLHIASPPLLVTTMAGDSSGPRESISTSPFETSGISKALVTAKIPIASPQGRIQALEMEMKELRPEGRWQCQGQALSQGFWGGCLAVLVRFLGVVHLPVGKFGAHCIPMEWNLEEPRIVVDS